MNKFFDDRNLNTENLTRIIEATKPVACGFNTPNKDVTFYNDDQRFIHEQALKELRERIEINEL